MTNERDDQLNRFVNNQVFCCLTGMVNDLIDAGKIDLTEYLEESAEYEGERITFGERDELVEELESRLLEAETGEAEEAIQEKIDFLNDSLEWESPEIYEYWGVSKWFADRLEEKGEVIIRDYYVAVWGRQTTGQAISLDYEVGKIYDELQEKYNRS